MSRRESGRLAPLEEAAEWQGLKNLGSEELIALFLGGATQRNRRQASKLLETVGSLRHLHQFSALGIHASTGISIRHALKLLSACELVHRAVSETQKRPPEGTLSHERVAEWAVPSLSGLEHEEVWVLTVDARAKLRSRFQVGRGGAHGCALLPKDILTPVVRAGALGFVLVHNHPSGDPRPSQEDLTLTASLASAATVVGAPLLDHIIVGGGASLSLLAAGHLGTEGSPAPHG